MFTIRAWPTAMAACSTCGRERPRLSPHALRARIARRCAARAAARGLSTRQMVVLQSAAAVAPWHAPPGPQAPPTLRRDALSARAARRAHRRAAAPHAASRDGSSAFAPRVAAGRCRISRTAVCASLPPTAAATAAASPAAGVAAVLADATVLSPPPPPQQQQSAPFISPEPARPYAEWLPPDALAWRVPEPPQAQSLRRSFTQP